MPAPGSLSICRLPPKLSTWALTASKPDAATGEVAHLGTRRESRAREDVDERALARGLREQLGRDPAPVVRDDHRDEPASLLRSQHDAPARRLARLESLRGRLDAVSDGVSEHVHERLGEALEDHAVELGLGALDDELDLLALGVRDVADGAGERSGDRSEGQRARLDGGVLQGAEQAVAEIELVGELLVLGRVVRGDQVAEPLTVEHRLADEVEQDVELLGRNAHGPASRGLSLGARLAALHGRRRCIGRGHRALLDHSQGRIRGRGLRRRGSLSARRRR